MPPVCEGARSREGTHFAAAVRRDGQQRVLLDGKQIGPEYDEISHIVFSEDGRHMAFVGRKAGKWCVVVDGKPQRSFDRIGAPVWAPGKGLRFWAATIVASDADQDLVHVLYAAQDHNKTCVVVDGKPGSLFDGELLTEPVLSDDYKHVFYVVLTYDPVVIDKIWWYLFLDGVPVVESDRLFDVPPSFGEGGILELIAGCSNGTIDRMRFVPTGG